MCLLSGLPQKRIHYNKTASTEVNPLASASGRRQPVVDGSRCAEVCEGRRLSEVWQCGRKSHLKTFAKQPA